MDMWLQFLFGVLFCVVCLYAPAIPQLRAAGFADGASIALAPAVSIAEYVVLGVAFGLAGVPVGWAEMVGPVFLVGIVCMPFALRSRRSFEGLCPEVKLSFVALFALVGVVATTLLFVRTLGSPDAFAQQFDNASHLSRIEAFLQARRFSTIQSSTSPQLPIRPLSDIEFYPSAWNVIAALSADAVGYSPAVSENVTNAVVLAFVYPLSACALLSRVFAGDRLTVRLGSLCCFAFAAFPWGYIVSGPLYPNFAGFAVLPSVIVIFLAFLDERELRRRLPALLAFLLGCVGLVALQPNAVFTGIVVLVAYSTRSIWVDARSQGASRLHALYLAGGFFVVVAVFWVATEHLPIFAAVVSNYWDAYSYQNVANAVRDCLWLGFRNSPYQYVLSALVWVGVVASLRRVTGRWLLPPLAFFLIAFVATATLGFGDSFEMLISGFWYNDIDRIAACVAFVSMPFSALGLRVVLDHIMEEAGSHSTVVGAGAVAVICALVYLPSIDLPFLGRVETAIGFRENRLVELVTTDISLPKEEEDFLARCKEVVGDDEVLNNPFDGSAFAYGEAGINIRYRSFWPYRLDDKDSEEWEIVRWLYRIDSYQTVRTAVEETGDRYVLVLDSDQSEDPTFFKFTYIPVEWQGFTKMTDDTPGFEVVLSEGDMRLYRIVDTDE